MAHAKVPGDRSAPCGQDAEPRRLARIPHRGTRGPVARGPPGTRPLLRATGLERADRRLDVGAAVRRERRPTLLGFQRLAQCGQRRGGSRPEFAQIAERRAAPPPACVFGEEGGPGAVGVGEAEPLHIGGRSTDSRGWADLRSAAERSSAARIFVDRSERNIAFRDRHLLETRAQCKEQLIDRLKA